MSNNIGSTTDCQSLFTPSKNKKSRSIKLAKDLLNRGKQSLPERNFNLALSLYLQAFILIQEYLADTLEIVYGQRKVHLQNFLCQKILSLASDFSITSKKL